MDVSPMASSCMAQDWSTRRLGLRFRDDDCGREFSVWHAEHSVTYRAAIAW